jgi:CheY-like chemotaxis protein
MPKILVVDDEEDQEELIVQRFESKPISLMKLAGAIK